MDICSFCGNKHFREQRVQYIYRHDKKFLVVNDVPCEECEYCGEQYFKAQVLKKIEQEFMNIYVAGRQAQHIIQVPVEEFKTLQLEGAPC